MATAGMRLLTQKQNDAVWSNICGVEEDLKDGEEPGSGYKFAPQGDACGTIPGILNFKFYMFFFIIFGG